MTAFLLFLRKYWFHLIMAAAVVMVLWWAYAAGKESVQKDWDASVARGLIEVARLKEKQVVVTTKVETKYIDRIKTVREKGSVVIQKIPVYIPAGTPDLPLGFFLLNNAAATGQLPDAADISDGATIPAQAFAEGVVENYTICLANSEQLIGLQEWVREQQALNP